MDRLGLRFQRRDAPHLRRLEAMVKNGELGGEAASVFGNAALAAETGEPLIVYCNEPREVVEMAVAYIRYGVNRPVIEQLSGA